MIVSIPSAEEDTSVVLSGPKVISVVNEPVASGLNTSSERVAPRDEDEADSLRRRASDWDQDHVGFAVWRTPEDWPISRRSSMLKKRISVRCLSVHLGITYVPATVAGVFWQNWLRWANEVRTGMAKPLKAKLARVIITEAPKARIFSQVSRPTSLVILSHQRDKTTKKSG